MPFSSKRSRKSRVFTAKDMQQPAASGRRAQPAAPAPATKKRRPRIRTKSKGYTKRGTDMTAPSLDKFSAYKMAADKLAHNLVVFLKHLGTTLPQPQGVLKVAAVLEESGSITAAIDAGYPKYTTRQKDAVVRTLFRLLDIDMKKTALAGLLKTAYGEGPLLMAGSGLAGGLIGGMTAPKGKQLEGAGRGAFRGSNMLGMGLGGGILGAGGGAGLGALAAALAAKLQGKEIDHETLRPAAEVGLAVGGLGGAYAGGRFGSKLTDKILGPASWEQPAAPPKEEPKAEKSAEDIKNLLLPLLATGTIGTLGAGAAGALSGAQQGGLIGAIAGGKGHRMGGIGRGATLGAATGGGLGLGAGLGATAGAGLGAGAAALVNKLTGSNIPLTAGLTGGGAIGGLIGGFKGADKGYHMARKSMGPWPNPDEEKQGEAVDMNMGEGMASPEDAMQQGTLPQSPAGAPTSAAPVDPQSSLQDPAAMGMMPPDQGQPPVDPAMMQGQPPMDPAAMMGQQPSAPMIPGAMPPPPTDQPLGPQQPTPPSPVNPEQNAMFASQGLGGMPATDPASAIMSDLPDSISTDKMGSLVQRASAALRR